MLQRKDALSVKIGPSNGKFCNLGAMVFCLMKNALFMEALQSVITLKSAQASDIEHCLAQVFIVMDKNDEVIWEMALEDLFDELNLTEASSPCKIFEIIISKLKSLQCQTWNECLAAFFNATVITEYYSSKEVKSIEHSDNLLYSIEAAADKQSLKDLVQSNGERQEVDCVPQEINIQLEDGDAVWRREYFKSCPNLFFASIIRANAEKFLHDISKTVPMNLLEDIRSTNKKKYKLHSFILNYEKQFVTFVSMKEEESWSVFYSGEEFHVKLSSDIWNAILSSEEKSFFEMVAYHCHSRLSEEVSYGNSYLKNNTYFLLERLLQRKQACCPALPVTSTTSKSELEVTEEKLKRRFDPIFGQNELKENMLLLAKKAMLDKRRKVSLRQENDVSGLHMIFTGNPGTGKTMAARCMAGVLKDIGLIENENVIEVQRSDLVAEYIGATAKKTAEKIKKAQGGVLFVDEAYRLNGEGKDFGKEAVETMMAKMLPSQDKKVKNPVFIFAGYKKEMDDFLKLNAGLCRRIKNRFAFEDFSPAELAQITEKKLISFNLHIPHAVKNQFAECFVKLPKKYRSMWNAGICDTMADLITSEQVKRLDVTSSRSDLEKITHCDIKLAIEKLLSSQDGQETLMCNAATNTEPNDFGKWLNCVKENIPMKNPPEVILNIPNKGPIASTL